MSEQSSPAAARGRPKDPAKRQAILDAAKELFLSRGFADTSMDAVATAAGVSKLTVYSHFFDKETLFTAAVGAKCENQMPLPMFALERGDSVEELLQRIAVAFLAMIDSEDSIRLLRLLCTVGAGDSEMAKLFFEAGPQRTVREMERFLRRAVELEMLEIEDTAAASEQFFGMLMGCQHMQVLIGCCEAPGEEAIRGRAAKAVQLFLRAHGV